jgi:hypothetical protein
MEAQVRIGLCEDASAADVRRVFASCGRILSSASSALVTDWSPILSPEPIAGAFSESLRRSLAHVRPAELPDQILWDIDDGTFGRGNDAIRSVANLFRIIAICERFVDEKLSAWWIAGLNRSTGIPNPKESTAFENAAAFRNDDMAVPRGFIAINGLCVSISALTRLPITARSSAPSGDSIILADMLSAVASDYLAAVDEAEGRVRVDVQESLRPFVERYNRDRTL